VAPLADPAASGGDPADAFDVVVASLPGFGFGGAPREPGWNLERIAAALDTLMAAELGHDRYGVQGGDWGGALAAQLGSAHADHVAGIHVNFAVASPPADPTEEDRRALERHRAWRRDETGYSLVQGHAARRPDRRPGRLAGRPGGVGGREGSGLERLRRRRGARVLQGHAADEPHVLWGPESVASAARIYAEVRRAPAPQARVEVPTGVAAFPREPWNTPRAWVERRYHVTRWTDMPRGGHFAALEQPGLLLDDIRSFFRAVR
jgi:microsomal epoxide hydrolase